MVNAVHQHRSQSQEGFDTAAAIAAMAIMWRTKGF